MDSTKPNAIDDGIHPAEDREHKEEDHGPHKIKVIVDGKEREVRPGSYLVSEFKQVIQIDSSYELDQVINGELVPLSDDSRIKIKGGEIFISHVRSGGAS
jgi:hypothetical protein